MRFDLKQTVPPCARQSSQTSIFLTIAGEVGLKKQFLRLSIQGIKALFKKQYLLENFIVHFKKEHGSVQKPAREMPLLHYILAMEMGLTYPRYILMGMV